MKILLCLSILCLTAGFGRAGEASKSLRVLSWNIHHGEGADGKVDLARLAAVIQAQAPDVVLLQEVDSRCKRSGGVDQPVELAKLTGLQQVFGKAMDFQEGEYGQAILSRYPLSDLRIHRLPGEGEPRIAVSAVAETPIGPVTVAGIHLDYQDEARQLAQAQVASAALLEIATSPVILAGDFNANPDSRTLAVFGQAPWSVVAKAGPPATHPADKPTDEIDFTVVRGLATVKSTTVIAETTASDHRPLLTIVGKPE
jgi:endonuclease/exonuclease/phosphatase family metal-dependent hydrolase